VYDTPVPSPAYSGSWYEGIPIQIEAHAKPGWKFVEWTGDIQSQEAEVKTGFFGDAVLHARFEPHELPSVMISEIHYNPSGDLQGEDEDFEFLELFNYEKEQVDLSGYKFTDGITFTFPEGSYISPGEFLLLVSNPIVYENSGARYFQITGGRLDNAGEILTLCDHENNIIDQVHFDDHYPWPREPDGDGPSLELQSPRLDNALASSWQASQVKGGSPGFGHYTSVKEGEPFAGNELQITVFPNPFHLTAHISYSLREERLVSIRILNMIGQEVDNLGVTKQLPGYHQVTWTPRNLPDGVYFIQFGCDEYVQFRKVLYLGKH
jgi:hypothetical protein